MRKLTLIVATVVTATAFGGSALAEPPIKLPPPGEYTIFVPASETPCGSFMVELNDQSKGRLFTRPDGTELLHFAGTLSGVVTSLESGESIALAFTGPVWVTPTKVVLNGTSLIFNPGVFELVHGRVTVLTGQTVDWSTQGSRTDLCAVLNP